MCLQRTRDCKYDRSVNTPIRGPIPTQTPPTPPLSDVICEAVSAQMKKHTPLRFMSGGCFTERRLLRHTIIICIMTVFTIIAMIINNRIVFFIRSITRIIMIIVIIMMMFSIIIVIIDNTSSSS